MKNNIRLHITLLIFICSAQWSFGQVLDKNVSIQFQNISLEQALKKIKTTCGVNFSYSPDQIDDTKMVTLSVSNVSLDQALQKLLKNAPVSYRAVGNQIVLKKAKPSAVQVQHTSATKGIIPQKPINANTMISLVVPLDTVPDKLSLKPNVLTVTATDSAQAIKELAYSYEKERVMLHTEYEYKKDSLNQVVQVDKHKLKENWRTAQQLLYAQYRQLKDSIKFHKKITELAGDSSSPSYNGINDELLTSKGQFTFVYPIGTKGANSGFYRNTYSSNLLVGYNGALRGVGIGGIANVVRKEVHGVQFAGITNVTGEYVRGVQFAGICNITREEVIGTQFAGITNVTHGDIAGVQVAGLVNVSAGRMDGVQIASINEHNGTINGGQIGLVNHARKVTGSQLGLINISDTINGMPIGLLSIARNGYGRAESYYSETTQLNFLYKTGVQSFYNIFQIGGNFTNNRYRWSFGYGAGSAMQLSKGSTLSFDLIGMHINDNEGFTNKINEQAQLRILISMDLAKRLALFVGPTFNAGFSELNTNDNNAPLIPRRGVVYEHTIKLSNGKDIYNPFWIGFQAGLRF